jgi:hypothetical protein
MKHLFIDTVKRRRKFESVKMKRNFYQTLLLYFSIFFTELRRWEDNIKMDLKETGCERVEWIHAAQDRVQWRIHLNTVNE